MILRAAFAMLVGALSLAGADFRGHVMFGGLPLPGATVTLTQAGAQGGKSVTAVADETGSYSLTGLADGAWHAKVEMLCFTTIEQDVQIGGPDVPGPDFDMKVLPLEEIEKTAPAPPPPPPISLTPTVTTSSNANTNSKSKKNAPAQTAAVQPGFQRTDVNAGAGANAGPSAASDLFGGQNAADLNQRASDGLLVNGSSMNGAASAFSQAQSFGNNRRGPGSLYNGSVAFTFDNSVLDAKNYSLAGPEAKPDYDRLTFAGNVGGPLRLPHVHWQQPASFFVGYQLVHNRNDTTQTGLVPTMNERMGILPDGTVVPQTSITPQAQALLALYPMPNFNSGIYNYQTVLASLTSQNSLNSRINKTINQKNQIAGVFAFQKTTASNPNLFQFLDHTDTFGFNAQAQWNHRFTQRFYAVFGYQFSRLSSTTVPYWANRTNVSGNAGITGNDQSSLYWGPPSIGFTSSGISGLSDANPSATHNQTGDLSNVTYWYRSPHTVQFGGDWKPIQFNSLSQNNPRGSFSFIGPAGSDLDLEHFLLGEPDAESIAYGNADKYFRTTSWDAFINDDWRVSPGLTLNGGVRWEYSAPITELYGRLVNLDVTQGFGAIAPVEALSPTGSLTGTHYPDSLMKPDKHAFEPRVSLAWRPFPASSMIVKAGYGVYYNTSVYQSIATQLAQQPPLSKTFTLPENGCSAPLALNSFNPPACPVTNTFGIDPNFKIGYAHIWQASVQRDLPGGMVMIATYNGVKGTRQPQEFLPNTYPLNSSVTCTVCAPSGFIYETSNGNSNREAGTLQLRRRLHAGLTAQVQYTYAEAIDDGVLGGSPNGQAGGSAVIAQNWLNLDAERGLSTFDQRHQVTGSWQYSTGEGINGGTLLSGWRGRLYKEWTFTNSITWGTGLPETPLLGQAVPGTGVTSVLRPDYTGAPVYQAAPGFFVNSGAFVAPAAGMFGDAGRDIITGPQQFAFNMQMARVFRLTGRYNLEFQLNSSNTLNHVTWTGYNMNISNPLQFGYPSGANAMRVITTTFRLRF